MKEVSQAARLLVDAGVLTWDRVASLGSLPVSSEFNSVCLDTLSSYESVFLSGLSLRYFNFCLNDQSYFQFSKYGRDCRFAFYPNPFTDPDNLLALVDDPVDLGSFEISDFGATAGRAPLRFDLSPDQYVDIEHPYAHFHLGHGELGRLASSRLYCPLSFCMFVMRLYYPDDWQKAGAALRAESGFSNGLDARLSRVMTEAGSVGDEYFTRAQIGIPHLR